MNLVRYLITPLLAMAVCVGTVAAQQPEEAKPSGETAAAAQSGTSGGNPAEIRKYADMVLGTWTVRESHEGSDMMPAGNSSGTAMFRNGPGALSVVENLSMNGSMGKFTGMGIVWYDSKRQAYKGVWCDSMTPACDTGFTAKWEGDKLVATGSSEAPDGKKMTVREEYTDITPNSFTFTMYGGPDENSLKKFMTMKYTRKSGSRPANKGESKK
jgi:hypothetical protein